MPVMQVTFPADPRPKGPSRPLVPGPKGPVGFRRVVGAMTRVRTQIFLDFVGVGGLLLVGLRVDTSGGFVGGTEKPLRYPSYLFPRRDSSTHRLDKT